MTEPANVRDRHAPSVVMLGTFGLRPKGTMSARALPLAQELAARGWRARLVLPPWDAPADAGRVEQADQVTVEHVRLSGGAVAVAGRMVAAARAWRRTGAGGAPPIVHCFKPKGYGGLAAAALRLAGWPLVVDNDDWEGPGGWNERVAGYTAAQRLLFAWQAWALPRRAHAVTVASRTLETQAWGLGIAPARVHYLPNGVSARRHAGWQTAAPAAGARAALGLASGPVALLYTRFDVVTPARVVALLAALRRRLPEARLLVVGRGLAGEEARLLTLVQAAGLAEALVPAGFVPFEQLPATLLCADVALYPIADTLVNRAKAPMKLLEVMALGLPVVAEAVGETVAYIEPGVSGCLVAPGDDDGLAAVAARLLDSAEERRRLGAAARLRVWQEFTWTRLTDTAERAYRQACDG
jgi:glycosyltransferase involved in cell wall biosynthesis